MTQLVEHSQNFRAVKISRTTRFGVDKRKIDRKTILDILKSYLDMYTMTEMYCDKERLILGWIQFTSSLRILKISNIMIY